MQNRRVPANDGKGEDNWLSDEKDEFGRGIRVPATYYVQIFDSKLRSSVQRSVQ